MSRRKIISLFALVLVLCWSLAGRSAAVSALLGAVTCVVPYLYFEQRFFLSAAKVDPRQILRSFYWGEFIKLLLTATLIALSLGVVHAEMVPFFTTFFGAHMGFRLGALMR